MERKFERFRHLRRARHRSALSRLDCGKSDMLQTPGWQLTRSGNLYIVSLLAVPSVPERPMLRGIRLLWKIQALN